MYSIWLRKDISHKKHKNNKKLSESKKSIASKYHLSIRTLKIQFPTIAAIVLSDIFIRYASGSDSIVIIVLLGIMIYTALAAGLKQGLTSALLIVLFSYYIIATFNDGPWLSISTLQQGAVIAVAFPSLAYVIGRLKERNDALLAREQNARKKAESSEKQLRHMAKFMPQKIFTMKPNGDIDYINPQWNEYTGSNSNNNPDKLWSSIIHPDDIYENKIQWQHALEAGQPFQFEHRLKRKDGKYLWHITRAHALRDENDSITMWIGSTTDIEDVRKTRELEASTASLIKERSQLMELNNAKDEFISIASHQLRTPATGVKQYINMVLDGYAGKISSKARAFLVRANASNERQLSVINDLLRVAHIDAGEVVLRKEDVDIKRLIKDIIREQRSKFSARKQTVKLDPKSESLRVKADNAKLRMVIENVIDNASKYTPAGKNITVYLTHSRGLARITVSDEGVGIARKDLKKVFQKFQRLDNPLSTEVGGNGLGLYWVQKVVELHGGKVSVTSKLGEGSSFIIFLPL